MHRRFIALCFLICTLALGTSPLAAQGGRLMRYDYEIQDSTVEGLNFEAVTLERGVQLETPDNVIVEGPLECVGNGDCLDAGAVGEVATIRLDAFALMHEFTGDDALHEIIFTGQTQATVGTEAGRWGSAPLNIIGILVGRQLSAKEILFDTRIFACGTIRQSGAGRLISMQINGTLMPEGDYDAESLLRFDHPQSIVMSGGTTMVADTGLTVTESENPACIPLSGSQAGEEPAPESSFQVIGATWDTDADGNSWIIIESLTSPFCSNAAFVVMPDPMVDDAFRAERVLEDECTVGGPQLVSFRVDVETVPSRIVVNGIPLRVEAMAE